ncbi:hypothetical protein EWM62_18895 [Mucilaginibacter terrigena]|uniref:DUF262 domain-containing protein n=1 Tax=Mucilaginibacter terrigena TaxID=2492395 RepID=A0A4Q5LKR9_9SPHI|nr:hypothetical protein [Mucilaginibacter terrigena]RYU85905.1 hypothetical protein EWM62_18895 [Mucilaginibacter terrigena]
MAIKLFTIDQDEVINSEFITGKTNYDYALKHFLPLIDRLEIQRKGQDPKFYGRLESDILKGCIMPPITLAFVGLKVIDKNLSIIQELINSEIENAFILDGLQRLRTLQRAANNKEYTIDMNRPVFVNILLCDSMDKLLYRMITLNNGQKPMTARHQIEIIASNVYDFSNSTITIQTEKHKSKKVIPGAFKQADFIKAYLAFLSKSINIDNAKIIEGKMDELIADKILDTNIKEQAVEFTQVIDLIDRFTITNPYIKKWFQNVNNLIGFSSAISNSFQSIFKLEGIEFDQHIRIFEKAFEYFDVSKIRVGDIRRKTLSYFIRNFEELRDLDDINLVDVLSQEI